MFGMMMNKSRRLLRRASSRENLLRKQREKVEEGDAETAGGRSSKRSPFSLISQSYAVGISEVDDLDSPLEVSNSNSLSGNSTSKILTRSSSCTNVFFGRHFSEFTSLSGTLTGDQYKHGNSGTSEIDLTVDKSISRNSRTQENDLKDQDKRKSASFRSYTTVISDQNVSAGTGSCTDLSYSRSSGDYGENGGRPRLETFPTDTAVNHRIGLRFEISLPGTRAVNTGVTASNVSGKTYDSGASSQNSTDLTENVNRQENPDIREEKKISGEKQENCSHSNQPNKTLLRSRSCSFIVSLSYKLKDNVKLTSSDDVTKSKNNVDADTANDEGCTKPQEKSQWKDNGRSARQFHRLLRSRSLLNFAGFTKDTQSGKVKREQVPSGRKSTILENDNEVNEDRFDDIFSGDKTNNADVHTEKNVHVCPLKQQTDTSDKEPSLQLHNAEKVNKNNHDSKYGADVSETRASDVTASNDTAPVEKISDSSSISEKNDENLVEQTDAADYGYSHGDHKCTHSDCRQCQFMSQFVVPEKKPDSPSKSKTKNKHRNPRNQRKNIFGKHISTRALEAIYLPTINFHQGRGGKGILQRDRSRDIPGRNPSLEAGASYPPDKCSGGAGLSPHPPRAQPHHPRPPQYPNSKRPSLFQAKMATLTKALGIFAKRNDLTVKKPSSGMCESKDKDKSTTGFPVELSGSNRRTLANNNAKTKQQSVDDIICSRLGVSFSIDNMTVNCPQVGFSDADLKRTPKKSADKVKDKFYTSPSEEKPGKTELFLHGVASSPQTRRTLFSPNTRKPSNKFHSKEDAQNAIRKQKIVSETSTEDSSFEEHKEDVLTQISVSTMKISQGNTRTRQNTASRKIVANDVSKNRPKQRQAVKEHDCSTLLKTRRVLNSSAVAKEKESTSQSAPSTTKGFYNVLPPISDDNILQQQQETGEET